MRPPLEPVTFLKLFSNRWVTASTRRGGSRLDTVSPEVVKRKVKALLNKLTMDQIIAWANKLEKEKDSRTLIQVVNLILGRATDEATFSEMRISSVVGSLRGPPLQRPRQQRPKPSREQTRKKGSDELELYSDEYYAEANAKCRGLGLIRFIGELFKLQMLTERNHARDVIELRKRQWILRNPVAAPTKITRVHEAGRQREACSRQSRLHAAEAPACRVVGLVAVTKVAPMSFAPSNVFDSKRGDLKNRDSPMSRTASSPNMFSMFESSDATVDPPTSKGSRHSSHKPGMDLGVRGPPKPVRRRRKLQLLPRTKPVGEVLKVSTRAVSEAGPDDEAAGEGGTPAPAAIKSKINEDVKEFFAIRMLTEAESYFSSLLT
ncbi:hypothetical protein BJY52DRAFT_1414190 [Lactarius psammicola]|nr:hypothetical protein BJY52DRAFT_1414190 [Lactarius psammicola]